MVAEGRLADGLGLVARVPSTGVWHDVPSRLGVVGVFAPASRHEGLPNVVIQAMAAGAVSATTDVGSVRDFVLDRGDGVVVAPGHVDQSAAAIDSVLANDGMGDSMRGAGRRCTEERLSVEAIGCATEGVYATRLVPRGMTGSP